MGVEFISLGKKQCETVVYHLGIKTISTTCVASFLPFLRLRGAMSHRLIDLYSSLFSLHLLPVDDSCVLCRDL